MPDADRHDDINDPASVASGFRNRVTVGEGLQNPAARDLAQVHQ